MLGSDTRAVDDSGAWIIDIGPVQLHGAGQRFQGDRLADRVDIS